MYLKGQNVIKSEGIAKQWFKKASGNNYPEADAALSKLP
jgi:hypothetical protein